MHFFRRSGGWGGFMKCLVEGGGAWFAFYEVLYGDVCILYSVLWGCAF